MIRENEALLNRLNIITDLAVLFFAVFVSYIIRFHLFVPVVETHLRLPYYLLFVLAMLPIYCLIFCIFDLISAFRFRSFSEEVVKLIQANTVMAGVITAVLFVMKWNFLSRWVMVQYVAAGWKTLAAAMADALFAGKGIPQKNLDHFRVRRFGKGLSEDHSVPGRVWL